MRPGAASVHSFSWPARAASSCLSWSRSATETSKSCLSIPSFLNRRVIVVVRAEVSPLLVEMNVKSGRHLDVEGYGVAGSGLAAMAGQHEEDDSTALAASCRPGTLQRTLAWIRAASAGQWARRARSCRAHGDAVR
jgi:hypothetical protein